MQSLRCACPKCGTTLRVKDRTYLNRPIPCPACETRLIITLGIDDQLSAMLTEVPAVPVSENRLPNQRLKWNEQFKSWVSNVTIISWGATLLIASLILVVANWPKRPIEEKSHPFLPVAETAKDPIPSEQHADQHLQPDVEAVSADVEPGQTDQAEAAPQEPPPIVRVEDRLRNLGERVIGFAHQQGHWPTEHPPRSFLSDLLSLRPDDDEGIVHDEFLNPLLSETLSPEGRGLTHFVGVAGVGPDAANLPVDHPRSGIFGTNRITKVEHVTDGLSDTLLLMGVEEQLGPWSAAGPTTIRPLTAEPYLHGPDGLGTGQAEGQFVLLADGAVKFLAAETDPILMRRMAAMADGQPLDLSVPGDPATGLAQKELIPGDKSPKATPPLKPDDVLPPIDFDVALNQPLLEFKQNRALPRRELLDILEEMIGAPIQCDEPTLGDAAKDLDQPISVDLRNITVKEVLNKVLEQSDLTYEREKYQLRLQRKADSQDDPSG